MKLSLILVICVCVCVARKGDAWHQIEDQRNDDDIIKNDDIDDVISDITNNIEKLDVFDDDVKEISLKEILSADAKPAWFKGIIRKVVKKVGTGVKKAARRVTNKHIKAVVNTFKRLKVCYPPYGCFTNQKPWNLIWHVLPKPPSDIRTFYELHTRRNPTGKRLNPFRVRESGLDGRKKTIIIIHGWLEHYDELVWNRRMKDELLKRGDFNVIGVYWPGGARTGYFQAAGNTRLVGAQVAYLIEKLCLYQKLSYRRVHLIGFSLGAHVAGFAGRRIREKRHRIARITGLDPAGPVFSRRPNKARLDSTDANFVDVLHTSFLYLVGIKDVSGDVDFYVNGGGRQPGCLVKGLLGAACSHSRAIELFTRTINPKCTFTAYKCKSYSRFRLGWCRNCRKANCVTMGYDTPTTARGRYYVRTSAKKPFC